METSLLQDILIIFTLSIFVLLLCHKLKIPTVVGFLLTGVIAGPGGFALVPGFKDAETLSEIGIILLLFTVGLEFSIKKIFEAKRDFFIGGVLQVVFTVLAGFAISWALGRPIHEAFFLGFLLSLSSTAIVIKIVQDKNETATPHGKAILGILIFQDVIAIPMMLLIPLLAGSSPIQFDSSLLFRIFAGLALLSLVFYAALYVMPKLLDRVTKIRSRELFLLTVLVSCFAVAWGSLQLGLSLSIGAFLAGLIISDSEYSTEALSDIIPFRDLFTSFFFISIGMLCNVHFVLENPVLVIATTFVVLLVKAQMGTLAVAIRGLPLRNAVIAGCSLAGIGEFSFVLAKAGFDLNLGTPFLYQLFLDVSLLTMALTPLIINLSEGFARKLLTMPIPDRFKTGLKPGLHQEDALIKDHVVILGFGITGRNLARVLKSAGIPYVIAEMDSQIVKNEKKNYEPIHFGDGANETVLHHLGIERAKVLAVSINDPVAALRATQTARKVNPEVYIISRTRKVQEMSLMAKLGANDVIPDEFGTSVEIFTRVLRLFQITEEEISKETEALRQEGYSLMRQTDRKSHLSDFQIGLDDVKMETFLIEPLSILAGKTLKESDIRSKCGVTVMLIRRKGETLSNLLPDTLLESGDRVVVLGNHNNIILAKSLFKNEKDPSLQIT